MKVTTNWWRHLNRIHPQILKEKEALSHSQQQTLSHLIKDHKKYDSKNPKQIQGSDALVNFIAEDLIPLAIVDSKKFMNFVEVLEPSYQVPRRKHMSGVLLKRKYAEVKQKVLGKLSKEKSSDYRFVVKPSDEVFPWYYRPLHFRPMDVGVGNAQVLSCHWKTH